MVQCWRAVGVNAANDQAASKFYCVYDTITSIPSGVGTRRRVVVDGVTDLTIEWRNGLTFQLQTTMVNCPNCGPPPPLSQNQPHDCINGNCLPKTSYNTPGIYSNLAACQSACAKNSNCTGECVPVAEIATLRSAVTALQQRICK